MKLQQLADNKIRLVQEQIQLENSQKDLFGIRVPVNSFRKDVENATNFWLSSSAIQNMIRLYFRERVDADKEFLIGEKAIKDLRLSQETKSVLLSDFEAFCFPPTAENKAWERVLKSANTHFSVTFSPESSDYSTDVMLITLAHPLVRQAAMFLNSRNKCVAVLKVSTDKAEPGVYPFIMYQWMYSGERENLVLKPVCNTLSINKYLLELLHNSRDYGKEFTIHDDLWNGIEAVQHSLWERELQKYKLDTHDLITYKLGTLASSHQSRISFITEQIRKASNPKIRIMREAELRNANMDFELRKSKLQETLDKVDIVVSRLSYGILVCESI